MRTTVDVRGLHAALDAAREERGWSWRQLARELELTPSTMSRLANGQKPEVDAFAVMVSWLKVDAEQFMLTDEGLRRRASEPQPELLAELSVLLRARNDLDERDVEHIEQLVGAAVRRFRADRSTAGS